MAKEFGATHTVNAGKSDPEASIRELTDGRGVDYAFEVIGNPKVIAQAYASLKRAGKCVVVGAPPFGSELTVPSFYGSAQFHHDMPRLIDLLHGGAAEARSTGHAEVQGWWTSTARWTRWKRARSRGV